MKFSFPPPPDQPATRPVIQRYCQAAGIPVSVRTIERWPLPYRVINNKATSDWSVVIAFLDDRYNNQPLHNAAVLERLTRKLPPRSGTAA